MRKLFYVLAALLMTSIGLKAQNELAGTLVEEVTVYEGAKEITGQGENKEGTLNKVFSSVSRTGNSSEVGYTEGQLSVSLSGSATYTIPIAVPPGINGVEPDVTLNYSSQSGNGMAGWGWDIGGISKITKIPSTLHHDGVVGTTDDGPFRYALDGQRLVLKSGTYGLDGSVYQTENYSNIIVKMSIDGYDKSFEVRYPDGSLALYGTTSNYTGSNGLEFAINYWQNAQGIRINYEYLNQGPVLAIKKITYGSRLEALPINEIEFKYKDRIRKEHAATWSYYNTISKILYKIEVKGNVVGYRNYNLTHDETSLGYERLVSVTESSGDEIKSYNPTVFNYLDTTENFAEELFVVTSGMTNTNYDNSGTVTGDFTGDGSMDMIMYPTTGVDAMKKYWLFKNVNGEESNFVQATHSIGDFETVFSNNYVNHNNKLMPQQGWTVVQNNGNVAKFKTYSTGTTSPIYFQYEKVWNKPTYTTTECNESACDEVSVIKPIPTNYYNGDFNGDGITDVIAIENKVVESCQLRAFPPSCNTNTIPISSKRVHFIDLNQNVTSNYVSYVGDISSPISSSQIKVADVTGNGKANLIQFSPLNNGMRIRIYELDDSNQLVVVGGYSDPYHDFGINRPFLMGDFNGDGKTDIVYPLAADQDYWRFLFSNGEGVNSNFFSSKTGSIGVNYSKNECTNYVNESYLKEFFYIANDFDGDGKTDILYYENSTEDQQSNISCMSSQGNPDYFKMKLLSNKEANSGTINFSSYPVKYVSNVYRKPVPLFLKNQNSNFNSEFALLTSNKIIAFKNTKNHKEDVLLRQVTNGFGITETISYNRLLEDHDFPVYPPVYNPSTYTETYPNTDIKNAPGFRVVSKIERQSGNDTSTYARRLFNYHGAVTNMEGLGFLGFRSLLRTNWHNDNEPIISTVTKHDPALRGAVTESYTISSMVYSFWSFNPSSFLSKTINTYESELLANKVFKIKNTITETFNGIDNTSSHTTRVFDDYNNVEQTTTVVKEGATPKQTTVVNMDYDNMPSGLVYYIGLPSKKTTSTIAYGNTFTGEEQYFYDSNLNLEIYKKKGHNTPFITEINVFDDFGNIIQKTLQANGEVDRVTYYDYDDNSGRFLEESTDIEGLKTSYTYNTSTGWLLAETNPFGQTTTYEHDVWGKHILITDFLGKTLTTTYTKNNNDVKITTTGEDGSVSHEWYDFLGRKIKEGVKNIQGTYNYVSSEYNIYNRPKRVSEPHTGSPSLWNETEYDSYGRPIVVTEATGKVTNLSYNQLYTTIDDGYNAKTIKKDPMGNVVQLTDAGGTINYSYFANGNLKNTNYSGSSQGIQQDGWGRKTKLIDPSAGVYEYEYNGFGEVIKETTPKGITIYELDDVGKLERKTVTGDHTNMETVYFYHPLKKVLNTMIVTDNEEGGTVTNYQYGYDYTKMLLLTISEYSDVFQFGVLYAYDDFGRVDEAMYVAQAGGVNSTKNITYDYQNGYNKAVYDADNSNALLWNTSNISVRGQLTGGQFGNGVTLAKSYDAYGYLTNSNHINFNSSKIIPDPIPVPTESILSIQYGFNAQQGVLNSRKTTTLTSQAWEETFVHDNMNRLTQITGPSGIQSLSYDTRGRIDQNSLIGDYNYSGNSYLANSVDLNSNGQDYYQDHPLQSITYNAFKQPVSIQEENHDRINFDYNTFGQRSIMYYGSNDIDKENRPYRKYYSSIAPMEIKQDVANGIYEFFTYLGGDQYTAPVVYKQEGTDAGAMLYLHRDYLGSILAITDQDKNVLEKRHFSAWGSLEYFEQNGNGILLNFGDMPNMLLDRGYTGHEHLYGTKLIHMNGRLYDPVVRRFLSPDNYVQDPFNTQNFNRYGYVLNSPLMYTDPSGELFNCSECDYGDGFFGLLGGIIGTVATMWDEWRIGDWLGNNFDSAVSDIDNFFTDVWKSVFPGSRDPIVYNNALQGFSNSQSVKGWQNEGIGSSGVERMYNAYTDISSGWQNGITQWGKDTAAFVSNPLSSTVQAINASVSSGKEFANNFANSGESDLGNYIMKGAYNTASNMSLYDWSYAAGYMAPDLALGMGGGYVMSTVRMPVAVARESARGGLNLFKWGAPQTTRMTGWKVGDYMLHLPDKGTPKLNWKANYGALRREMSLGKPIFDSYRFPNGDLIPTGGFLNAERSILQGRGWNYNPFNGAWMPPGF